MSCFFGGPTFDNWCEDEVAGDDPVALEDDGAGVKPETDIVTAREPAATAHSGYG